MTCANTLHKRLKDVLLAHLSQGKTRMENPALLRDDIIKDVFSPTFKSMYAY